MKSLKTNASMVLAALLRAVLLAIVIAGPLAALSAPRAKATANLVTGTAESKNTGMGFVLLVSLQRAR